MGHLILKLRVMKSVPSAAHPSLLHCVTNSGTVWGGGGLSNIYWCLPSYVEMFSLSQYPLYYCNNNSTSCISLIHTIQCVHYC